MSDTDDGFTFGDFVFAPPQITPTHQNPDPFHYRVDPGPVSYSTRKGALPLSLFGEIEDEDNEGKGKDNDVNVNYNVDFSELNGGFDPNSATQNGKFVGIDRQIVSEYGSGLDLDHNDCNGGGDDDDEDFGEWEFRGAVSGNVDVIEDQGSSSVVPEARIEKSGVIPPDNQDAFNSVEHKPGFPSFSLQSNDLFAQFPGTVDKSLVNNGGLKSTIPMTNSFSWDAFSQPEDISNENGVLDTANNSMTYKTASSSSFPQSNDLFGDSIRDGNRSKEVANGFTWGAFSEVEKIGHGSDLSDTTAISVEHTHQSSSFFPPSDDLFAAPHKLVTKSSEMDVEVRPTNMKISSFSFDAFPEVENIGNRSEMTIATSSSSDEHKPDSSSFLFPSDNLFMVPQGVGSKTSETFGGFKKGFMLDAFPEVESVGTENGLSAAAVTTNEDDDFDDFGDFVDASQEVRTGEQEQVVPHMTVASETQLVDGNSQVKKTLLLNSREALPLSLFGDITEETSETSNHEDELVQNQTSNPGNGFSVQDSTVSIHDLISNLYSTAQSIQSADFDGKPAENGAHDSQEKESPSLVGDDEWDDDSWEFKGAVQESGIREQPSRDIPRDSAQIQRETSENVQHYIGFYSEMRDSLRLLLSCQLHELQKARCSDTETGTGFSDITETLDNEIEEIHKLIETSVVSETHTEKSSCLNEVFKILEEPEFKMIESEYSLSKNLQMAVNDWRVAAGLLRDAILDMNSLSRGSADELFHYVSTWSSIINVCAQELRYGASIWKRASEKKVQHRILSDTRGQKQIRALGEMYRMVELLGLSFKIYRAWLLCIVSDSSQLTGLLNECRALWSSSGLEETLQNLSDDINFGCEQTAKALLASIKNIRELDVLTMHDCVFGQPKSICRLSLLPQEMLPDLKTVMWNGEHYFLGLANLWANLISAEPPQ